MANKAARIEELEEAYSAARAALRAAIKRKKTRAWAELLLALD